MMKWRKNNFIRQAPQTEDKIKIRNSTEKNYFQKL